MTAAERQQRRRERHKLNRDTERSHETAAQAAELERLNAELAKVTRSREYWKRRVRDDERREFFAVQEPLWKEMEANKKERAGNSEWDDWNTEQIYEGMRQDACKQFNLQPRMPLELWRRMVQLTHPDKHGGSAAADEATRWLLANKPE